MSLSSSTNTQSPLPQQDSLDKTLIAGSVVTGVLFGVPAGIAFAAGYLASKENVASRCINFIRSKTATEFVSLPELNRLVNYGLISSIATTVAFFSAYKTDTAAKEEKYLEAVQWFSWSLGSAILASAACNTSNIN